MEKSPLTKRRLAEQQRLQDIEDARKTLARRKELRQREEEYNIVDRPLHEQLNDEIINLPKIDNIIKTDRNASGIRRSPSQPIRSQEEYNEYIERLAKQRKIIERTNRINNFQSNNQPSEPKKGRIRWMEGGKSTIGNYKRKQSKKIKKKNKRKNKRISVKR